MLFMLTKLVFVLLTNYYQLFHAFCNEIDTSRSPGTSQCTEIIYTQDEIRLGQPGHPGIPGSYNQGLNVTPLLIGWQGAKYEIFRRSSGISSDH